ncbi:MAG: type II secretion system F family protein [Phycisphaerales bacterium]
MPTFRYTALDAAGARVTGDLDVGTEQAALAELERRRLTPVSLAAGGERGGARGIGGAGGGRGVPAARLGSAYAQVGDLVAAGVPLLRALRVVGAQKSSPRVAAEFSALADAVADGTELGEAMRAKPRVFKPIHVALVRAGEKGGFLEQSLMRLGQLIANQVELRSKIVGSLIYPVAVMVFGLVVLLVLFAFFIPQFRDAYSDLELALPTVVVFAVSDAVTKHLVASLVVLGLAAAGVVAVVRNPRVRARLADASARAPVLGPLVRALAIARVCRILGTLLGNGVPMLSALSIVREAGGFPKMGNTIEECITSVRAGQPLAQPLRNAGFLPDDVVEMVAVGESANNLDAVLIRIADTLERRIDRLLSTAVRLIEPILIGALGVSIAFVAIGLILPMLQLTRGLSG